jgi:TatA/E family protein of Tat protein translocase
MFGIGMPEMILILAVALIVIGPKKLPDLAKSLGKAMGEFKKATSDLKESMQIDTELKDVKTAFDEMNLEKKKAAQRTPGAKDEESVVVTAPDGAADTGKPQTADTLEPLKTAFDRQNADAEDSGSPSGPKASDSGSGLDPETHKG